MDAAYSAAECSARAKALLVPKPAAPFYQQLLSAMLQKTRCQPLAVGLETRATRSIMPTDNRDQKEGLCQISPSQPAERQQRRGLRPQETRDSTAVWNGTGDWLAAVSSGQTSTGRAQVGECERCSGVEQRQHKGAAATRSGLPASQIKDSPFQRSPRSPRARRGQPNTTVPLNRRVEIGRDNARLACNLHEIATHRYSALRGIVPWRQVKGECGGKSEGGIGSVLSKEDLVKKSPFAESLFSPRSISSREASNDKTGNAKSTNPTNDTEKQSKNFGQLIGVTGAPKSQQAQKPVQATTTKPALHKTASPSPHSGLRAHPLSNARSNDARSASRRPSPAPPPPQEATRHRLQPAAERRANLATRKPSSSSLASTTTSVANRRESYWTKMSI